MSTLTNDQRFVVLLLIGLASGAWLSVGTTAQTFTEEDRGSILKFMDVLINFLDAAESDNATSTENPNNNATTTDDLESTTLSINATTDSSVSESTTASNATDSSTESSTEVTSNDTDTSSATDSTSTSSTTAAPIRRRICFKRVCYKFMNDKGYIV